MTWNELVREVFPDASLKDCYRILWRHTDFPAFAADEDARVCCRRQLTALKASGFRLKPNRTK